MNYKFNHILLTIIILITLLTLNSTQAIIPQPLEIQNNPNLNQQNLKPTFNPYEPHNISPKDAAYHPSHNKFTIEWWYFEGIFSNGYNAVVNIILFSRNKIGLCFSHLNIYHINSTESAYAERIIHPLRHFSASQTHPNILLQKNPIIQFNTTAYNTTKTWEYTLTYKINDHAVNLTFIGETPGWEGPVLGGYYGPVLPIAKAYGTITQQNQTINVTGLGYHEHAHGITFPFKEWGWYWGKIVGDNTSLFWGKMMDTRWHEQARAGVFSIKNHTYTNLNPNHIIMKLTNYVFHTKRFIPTTFTFNISDPPNQIYINVTMTTKNIFYLPLGIFHYWRYHIQLNGEIKHHQTIEHLHNKTQIMEVMRFR